MTRKPNPIAHRQGVRNALICVGGFLFVWLLLGGILRLTTGKPAVMSLGISFAVLFALMLTVFPAWSAYERLRSGRVLLDCGPNPSGKQMLINAAIFLALGVKEWAFGGSLSRTFGLAGPLAMCLLCSLFSLLMAPGRLQVRENGLWQYWGLLRWGKIASYQWGNDSTLLVTTKGLSSLLPRALAIPPEHKDAIDNFLQQHCPDRATLRSITTLAQL